jgi:predicted RNase H-like HicB family nuclease
MRIPLFLICNKLSYAKTMNFTIDFEQETDGRWLAEIDDLPGLMVYGATKLEAMAKVQALALRVVADRLEYGESTPEGLSLSFQAT